MFSVRADVDLCKKAVGPSVLLATSKCWPTTPRFAHALLSVGADIHFASPRSNRYVAGIDANRRHAFSHRFPGASLCAAIETSDAALVIPGDDTMLGELVSLYQRRFDRYGAGDKVAQLIERSLGVPQNYTRMTQRRSLIGIAEGLGIRVPETRVVVSREDVIEQSRQLGFPVVLKLDGSTGGTGTMIARDERDAVAKFNRLTSWVWHTKRTISAVRLREQSVFGPYLKRGRAVVNLQRFVEGRPANTAFACWKGEVVGAIHVEVLQEVFANGPAAVVRTLSDIEMDRNAAKIASHFRLSGIHGLDYMLDAKGVAHLIEMNPRLTPVAHLPLGEGHDLAVGLLSAITGERLAARPSDIRSDVIALFPQEWQRDPESPLLHLAHHDVPWGNASFLELFLGHDGNAFAGRRGQAGASGAEPGKPRLV